MDKSKIIIFYSWQSDLSKDTNQNGIRISIKSAIPLIETELENFDLILDEATRGVSGSPNIPSQVFEKISKADIFICDLSPVGENKDKKIANPNVLIELGYAIAELGWERIILLFNTNYGNFPNDLPFDVDRHRATKFKINDKLDKSGKNELTKVLVEAIKLIIEKTPLKPHEKKIINPEEKKRNLDIENLKRILNTINIETFDLFLEEAPSIIIGDIFHYQINFNSVFNSNSFHIYNQELLQLLNKLNNNWNEILSYGHAYQSTSTIDRYKFYIPYNQPQTDKALDELLSLETTKMDLEKDFKNLLKYVRNHFLEIDLVEANEIALLEFKDFHKSEELPK